MRRQQHLRSRTVRPQFLQEILSIITSLFKLIIYHLLQLFHTSDDPYWNYFLTPFSTFYIIYDIFSPVSLQFWALHPYHISGTLILLFLSAEKHSK